MCRRSRVWGAHRISRRSTGRRSITWASCTSPPSSPRPRSTSSPPLSTTSPASRRSIICSPVRSQLHTWLKQKQIAHVSVRVLSKMYSYLKRVHSLVALTHLGDHESAQQAYEEASKADEYEYTLTVYTCTRVHKSTLDLCTLQQGAFAYVRVRLRVRAGRTRWSAWTWPCCTTGSRVCRLPRATSPSTSASWLRSGPRAPNSSSTRRWAQLSSFSISNYIFSFSHSTVINSLYYKYYYTRVVSLFLDSYGILFSLKDARSGQRVGSCDSGGRHQSVAPSRAAASCHSGLRVSATKTTTTTTKALASDARRRRLPHVRGGGQTGGHRRRGLFEHAVDCCRGRTRTWSWRGEHSSEASKEPTEGSSCRSLKTIYSCRVRVTVHWYWYSTIITLCSNASFSPINFHLHSFAVAKCFLDSLIKRFYYVIK